MTKRANGHHASHGDQSALRTWTSQIMTSAQSLDGIRRAGCAAARLAAASRCPSAASRSGRRRRRRRRTARRYRIRRRRRSEAARQIDHRIGLRISRGDERPRRIAIVLRPLGRRGDEIVIALRNRGHEKASLRIRHDLADLLDGRARGVIQSVPAAPATLRLSTTVAPAIGVALAGSSDSVESTTIPRSSPCAFGFVFATSITAPDHNFVILFRGRRRIRAGDGNYRRRRSTDQHHSTHVTLRLSCDRPPDARGVACRWRCRMRPRLRRWRHPRLETGPDAASM